jgi:hypothetical protein
MRSRERERAASRTGIISEAVMPKRSERTRPKGGGASDFGITLVISGVFIFFLVEY